MKSPELIWLLWVIAQKPECRLLKKRVLQGCFLMILLNFKVSYSFMGGCCYCLVLPWSPEQIGENIPGREVSIGWTEI